MAAEVHTSQAPITSLPLSPDRGSSSPAPLSVLVLENPKAPSLVEMKTLQPRKGLLLNKAGREDFLKW